ncbi:MAG: hypothetical protein AABO57_22555 [Acidobacteriota bacterium]
MSFEVKQVGVILPSGNIADGEFKLWEEDPDEKERVKLSLTFRGKEISVVDGDFFSAMRSIRRELEKEGMVLNCYGGSKNVYPSPMSQDMGSGWKAYRLTIGRAARLEDLVSIFEVGPDVVPSSVEEQEAFFKSWAQSLG